MQVELAACAGFCFGVKRAVDTVHEQLKTGKTIYTYGPIVHNEEVVKELEDLGVKVLNSKEELMELSPVDGEQVAVVIRAHGVPREIYELLEQKGIECVDATCPFVKRIHKIVEEGSRNGNQVFIAGNPGHPEVEGIRGWCHGDAIVVETVEETQKLTIDDKKQGILVAQTTFNFNKFDNLVEIFQQKGYNGTVVNTICNATEERQRAARELAKRADVMIVIGGKHSSNTRKLYDICSSECANTYYIQTLDDLSLVLPTTVRLVGITAGASTPNKLIEEVQNYVRINF
ncbi:MAG: 4-hydroxy-3-methylbut-2-enyl diphosphate reductase [Lachnospiraceae bacterium]|nr:4-hydroxy-3-methylbut-2-enyl diphosphate reductase [Lachnospiraceae bacterium]